MSDPVQHQPEDMDFVPSTEPSKQRKFKTGNNETTTLRRYGNRSTQTTVKALCKGSGKDGRPLVADLIRLRENESKLVQELANENSRSNPTSGRFSG